MSMKRYWHQVETVLRSEDRFQAIRKMENDGWELCAVEANDYSREFYWKRQLPAQPTEEPE